jgi:hypothetical protein
MDKNTKKLQESARISLRRNVIIPFKRHLAKYIIAEQKKVDADISSLEIDVIRTIITSWFGMMFDEDAYLQKTFDFTFNYYTNRRRLYPPLQIYVDKGYTLLKVTVVIKKSAKNKPECLSYDNFYNKVELLNKLVNSEFAFYVSKMIRYHNIDNAIDEIYNVLNLKASDLKKSTMRRNYFRGENSNNFRLSKEFKLGCFKISKSIPDSLLVEIYKEHYKQKYSYSQLAQKHSLSKSSISRICNNPKVKRLYQDLKRYPNK